MNPKKNICITLFSAAIMIAAVVMSVAYALPASAAYTSLITNNPYMTPTITPPLSHPRLLFKTSDIPTIKANMQKSQNSSALSRFNGSSSGGKNKLSITATGEYLDTDFCAIEAWAFDYAINKGDSNQTTANAAAVNGQKAVDALIKWLPTVTFSSKTSDACRAVGHVIFTASEVYDWCYPLLSASQRETIVQECERIAVGLGNAAQPGLEVGYPPSKQGAVCGHGGEAQILRDVLSLGVATYNEYPNIYNYSMGRLQKDFVPTRNFWYTSATYHQGDAYGPYRYCFDLWAQIITYNMSGQYLFNNDTMSTVPYEWIYNRRNDGQLFRNGDCFFETASNSANTYWKGTYVMDIMASGFFGDPYIKESAYRQYNSYNSFTYYNTTLTPVQMFLFNNPDVAPKNTSTSQYFKGLPLSRYFGSPNGTMVARTGFNVNATDRTQINDAAAVMKIGEWWGANHNHHDAGTFQLYYKGILTGDTGVYDSYNSTHDLNYNKRTIAHNALTVFNPSETFYSGAANDGGQRSPNNDNEPANMSTWMNGGYQTGEVTGFAYDTANAVPEYSYIAGDITKAYSSKVSEVLRSMLFMPTGDPNFPAVFVVMDKITASNASYKKTFLLHYYDQEPIFDKVNKITTVLNQSSTGKTNGKMIVNTLLPPNASITNVGGDETDKAFLINGVNYPPTKSSSSSSALELGTGRIEISPATSANTDYFLNVMQLGDASRAASPLNTTLIETAHVAGAKIVSPQTGAMVAVFNKNKTRINTEMTFTVPGAEVSNKVFVAGLREGVWVVQVNGVAVAKTTVATEGGNAYFTAGSGNYSLVYMNMPLYIDDIRASETPLAGKTITFSANVLGSATNANVVFVAYNNNGSIYGIYQTPYTIEKEYSYTLTLPPACANMQIAAFVWDSDMSKLIPLAKTKRMTL